MPNFRPIHNLFFALFSNPTNDERYEVFEHIGNTGNMWTKHKSEINLDYDFYLQFEGTTSSRGKGDIAIDDIVLTPQCMCGFTFDLYLLNDIHKDAIILA